MLSVGLASCYLLSTERGLYLGMITIWATPVLARQSYFCAEALIAQRDAWLLPLMNSWSFLCGIDRYAIGKGCWSIPHRTSLPQFCWLTVEEA